MKPAPPHFEPGPPLRGGGLVSSLDSNGIPLKSRDETSPPPSETRPPSEGGGAGSISGFQWECPEAISLGFLLLQGETLKIPPNLGFPGFFGPSAVRGRGGGASRAHTKAKSTFHLRKNQAPKNARVVGALYNAPRFEKKSGIWLQPGRENWKIP